MVKRVRSAPVSQSVASVLLQNDSTSSSADRKLPNCCESSPRQRQQPTRPFEGPSLYDGPAAQYGQKFRAAAGYTLQEKHRQLTLGAVFLLFLYFIGFHGQYVFSPSPTGISHQQAGGMPGDSFNGDLQTARPYVALDYGAQSSRDTRPKEQEPVKEEKFRGAAHESDSAFGAEMHSSLGTVAEKTKKGGKHVTAPGVAWAAIFPNPTEPVPPSSHSVRRGVVALVVTIALYAYLQANGGFLVQPQPGFWRVVHGIGVAHLLLMVWLLAVSPEIGRETLQQLFPEIRGKRKDIFAGTLVADCRINVDTVNRQITSVWFASHVVGWLAKMIILRDWAFCLIYSISFEVAELSFHWVVPELRECWWDSVVVDALLSNLSGMLLGVLLLKIAKLDRYDWMGRRSLQRKVATGINLFGNGNEWAFYETPRHLGLAVLLLLLCVFTELNVFFLMAFLDIPAAHYCNPARALYLYLLSARAAVEHYEYTMNSQERIGHNEWLLTIILIAELMVCVKYGGERIRKAVIPSEICSCWGFSLSLFFIWCSCFYSAKRELVVSDKAFTRECTRRKSLHHVSGCSSMRPAVQHITQDAKDLSQGAVSADYKTTWGHVDVGWKRSPPSSLESTRQWMQWYRLCLRRWVLTIPPQACFLPLIYLSKYYYYDYEELGSSGESP